jgi:hypothetical protein
MFIRWLAREEAFLVQNMLKKTLIVGALIGGAMVAAAGTASASTAHTQGMADSHHGIGIANNACVLPWNWVGPGNVGDGGAVDHYSACNGRGDSQDGIANNACIAPWLWNGPLNVLDPDSTTHYSACNG